MTLIDTIMPRRAGRALAVRASAPSQATPIAAEIAEVQVKIDALLAERPDAAFDAHRGFAGAQERLSEIDHGVDQLQRRVSTLHAAHGAAVAVDDRARSSRLADQRRASVAAVARHLKERETATLALHEHIVAAISSFRELIDRSRQAEAARPKDTPWPEGSLTDVEELVRLLSVEIHRLDGRALPRFPTGAIPVLPSPISLADRVRAANRHCLGELARPPARRPGRHIEEV